MQEIGIILKSLNELEFLVTYQKQILATTTTNNSCTCDVQDVCRIYLNMKNLTSFLKNEFWKLYTENSRLKELNQILLVNSKQSNKFKSQQNLNYNYEKIKIFNVHASEVATTTLGKAIEETESQLAMKRQIPFNYLHNQQQQQHHSDFKKELSSISSSNSFTSSGYSSQMRSNRMNTFKSSFENMVAFFFFFNLRRAVFFSLISPNFVLLFILFISHFLGTY